MLVDSDIFLPNIHKTNSQHLKKAGVHMLLISASVGLVAAACWGSSDFVAGAMARRAAALTVVSSTNLLSGPVMLGLGLMLGETVPSLSSTVWAALAGVAAAGGSIAMSRGLARESAGVIAPVTGVVGAAVPVLVGAFVLQRPAGAQYLGFVLALAALWFLGGGSRASLKPRNLRSGIVGGLGFGVFYLLMPLATSEGIFLPNAIGNLAAFLVLGLCARRRGLAAFLPQALLPAALCAALLNSMGDLTYVLSAHMAGSDRAAIFAGFAPAATVFLARFVWRERLTRPQWAGVTAAVIAIPLIVG